MDLENYITTIKNSPMKENGMAINFMEKAKSIMIIGNSFSKEALTTPTFKITKPFGFNMTVSHYLFRIIVT